jgi:hypothetical protein
VSAANWLPLGYRALEKLEVRKALTVMTTRSPDIGRVWAL